MGTLGLLTGRDAADRGHVGGLSHRALRVRVDVEPAYGHVEGLALVGEVAVDLLDRPGPDLGAEAARQVGPEEGEQRRAEPGEGDAHAEDGAAVQELPA